jgi:hypothetical protein
MYIYSGDPNNGHPNTRNIWIPDIFSSNFWMAKAIWKLDITIQYLDRITFSASLDHLYQRTMFLNDSFISIKWSSLVTF